MKTKTVDLSVSSNAQVKALEDSLMQRAKQLAQEHLKHKQAEYDRFIQDKNEQLQLLEEKETLKAKENSERKYRRLVQVSELNIQKKLEQLRWSLVTQVTDDARENLQKIAKEKPEHYLNILKNYINHGVTLLKQRELSVSKIYLSVNADDQSLLQQHIKEITQQLPFQCKIELLTKHLTGYGGVIIYNESQTIRIDMTFEGLIKQLSEKIYQQVSRLYFAEISHESEKIHAG